MGEAKKNGGAGDRPAVMLLPLIEDYSVLSLLFGAFGVAYFAVAATTSAVGDERIEAVRLLLLGPFQIFRGSVRAGKIFQCSELANIGVGAMTKWVIPLVLGGIFVALFASANPLIEAWLSNINLAALLAAVSLPRLLFWMAMAMAAWPFVLPAIMGDRRAFQRSPPQRRLRQSQADFSGRRRSYARCFCST